MGYGDTARDERDSWPANVRGATQFVHRAVEVIEIDAFVIWVPKRWRHLCGGFLPMPLPPRPGVPRTRQHWRRVIDVDDPQQIVIESNCVVHVTTPPRA